MLKNRLAAVAATAALVTVSLTVASPAVAEPASPSASASTTAGCGKSSFPLKAKESVKIRKSARMSATALGLLPKGKKACFLKAAEAGKSGSCIKGTHDIWNKISYRGIKGWVPSQCVDVV
ncbi:hypothetical protein [Streptomyces sp. NPDC048172]|uniref:hypothetical protein n=1 Tax=Streptomyces sp. NPDC048172 TaxID=3365505 RepID=UPI003710E24C